MYIANYKHTNILGSKKELAELIIQTVNGESGHQHLAFGQDLEGNYVEYSYHNPVSIDDEMQWQGSVCYTDSDMSLDIAYDCIDNAKYNCNKIK